MENEIVTATATEYILGPLAQIPIGEGRMFDVGGLRIAVFHARSGAVYATQASCPHRSGPLADGLMGGSTLVCPLHAWKFDLATGAALLGDCRITTYPARLNEDGDVALMLDEQQLSD
jgi:nitrite reductase (NADH) small subunit